MPRKRKLNNKEISVHEIYEHLLSNRFVQNICDELYAAFQKKGSYTYLKNIGLHQISTSAEWTDTSHEEVQKEAKVHYNKIQEITSKIEEEMEQVIHEKFQGAFRNTVKEEILKFIDSSKSTDIRNEEGYATAIVKPLTIENVAVKENENGNRILEKVDNLANIEAFLDNTTSDSLSSVHTSDLSSFDDEISISSDEETGRERKIISLQSAQEALEQCRKNKIYDACEAQDQIKEEYLDSTKIKQEVVFSDSANEYEVSSPRRIRKPNSKYFSNDVLSPFEVDIEILPPSSSKNEAVSAPRKRGRPRKYPHKL